MFRPINPGATGRRRAVILMVVLVLLTLFAVVGLAFVLYAQSEANASRIYREFQAAANPDSDLAYQQSWALGQSLFDAPDNDPTQNGAYGSM